MDSKILRRFALAVSFALIPLTAQAQQPKSAILYIGDGMGIAQITAARIFKGNARDGQLTLDTLEHVALVRTYAADRMVTDSGASGTAMATGVKTNILMIGQDPDGNNLESILKKAKKAGKSVGLVSTTSITHATPASFFGNVPNRTREDVLAEQLVEYGEVDVVMGGGRQVFFKKGNPDPESGGKSRRRDDRDLVAEAKAAGYRMIYGQEEFDALRNEVKGGKDTGKILALFSPGMMSYEAHRANDKFGEPSIKEMTEVAIQILNKNPEGFFLMVEGGRIDHGSHANNAHLMATDLLAFDDAVLVGVEASRRSNDILIVVTADHETGGLSINGYPPLEISGTDLFSEGPGGTASDILTYATGPGNNREKMEGVDKASPDYLQPSLAPGGSAAHSGVDVPAYATGPGAEAIHGTMNNTDIGIVLIKALGLD